MPDSNSCSATVDAPVLLDRPLAHAPPSDLCRTGQASGIIERCPHDLTHSPVAPLPSIHSPSHSAGVPVPLALRIEECFLCESKRCRPGANPFVAAVHRPSISKNIVPGTVVHRPSILPHRNKVHMLPGQTSDSIRVTNLEKIPVREIVLRCQELLSTHASSCWQLGAVVKSLIAETHCQPGLCSTQACLYPHDQAWTPAHIYEIWSKNRLLFFSQIKVVLVYVAFPTSSS